jgi:23S rRNA (pseudouridine1915-N3)-methyltransferase
LKISFICVGSIKKGYIKDGLREYLKRIERYCPVELIEVKEQSRTKKAGPWGLKKEAARILAKVDRADYKVVLSESHAGNRERGNRGKSFKSADFAGFFERLLKGGKKRACFIVGGPFGLHPEVIKGADMVLSLSPMTMPHELATLVLAEQVYRAFTIIRGEPYSH